MRGSGSPSCTSTAYVHCAPEPRTTPFSRPYAYISKTGGEPMYTCGAANVSNSVWIIRSRLSFVSCSAQLTSRWHFSVSMLRRLVNAWSQYASRHSQSATRPSRNGRASPASSSPAHGSTPRGSGSPDHPILIEPLPDSITTQGGPPPSWWFSERGIVAHGVWRIARRALTPATATVGGVGARVAAATRFQRAQQR